MKDDEYCLSFTQVLDEMFRTQNNKIKYWYQGKDFKDGYFLELNEDGIVRLSAFTESSFVKQDFGNPILSKGMYTQKYRRVSTQPDVMRKFFG